MIQIHSFVFSPFSENTYILSDETKEAVIIDPGCLAQYEKEELFDYVADNKLIIKHLLQTHTHLDHVFGSAYVKRRFGVKMLMHKNELPILNNVASRCEAWGIKGFEPVEADEFIEEGQKITFGNSELDILFVPGHCPGHLAFVNHAQSFVIGGDCLFRRSIGRTDFPLCSHEDLMKSIKTKFYTLPDNFVVYSGHGEPTTIGEEKQFNPYVR